MIISKDGALSGLDALTGSNLTVGSEAALTWYLNGDSMEHRTDLEQILLSGQHQRLRRQVVAADLHPVAVADVDLEAIAVLSVGWFGVVPPSVTGNPNDGLVV